MSLLASAAEKRRRQAAECKIELAGSEIAELYPALVEVSVDSERGSATEATLIFETRRLEDGSWTVQDDKRFKPWATVKISAVFGDESEEIMRGFVRELKADYPEQKGAARVTVICQDHSLKLDREHINQTWGGDQTVTDEDIVGAIAKRHHLKLEGVPGQGQTSPHLHQNETDSRFLIKRAEANGYELVYSRGTVYFGPLRLDGEAQPTLRVYAGNDTHCINFELQDDGHQPEQVAYEIASDTSSQAQPRSVRPNLTLLGPEAATSRDAGLGEFEWRQQRCGISNEAAMAATAQASVNEQSMKIKVEGELDGSLYGHVLEVAKTVGVDGVGERYCGIYYVAMANHRFDVNGYRVSFRLLRNAYGDNLPGRGDALAGVR